jgi:hypothetical protein
VETQASLQKKNGKYPKVRLIPQFSGPWQLIEILAVTITGTKGYDTLRVGSTGGKHIAENPLHEHQIGAVLVLVHSVGAVAIVLANSSPMIPRSGQIL